MDVITVFLVVVALSIILNVFLKAFQLPTIIGYIITGYIVSKALGLSNSPQIEKVAEFGIVFLMFSIGLEFSLKHLMSMKTEVFVNGFLQMLICGLVFTGILFFTFHIDEKIAFILGCALALSSTAIVLKILNDSKDINKRYGRKALGILLFQDIAVIPLLLMIDIFSHANSSIVKLLLRTGVSAVVLLFLLYFLAKYIFNYILHFVVKTDSQEIFISTVLFIVVGASFLAHFFGFSYSLGAFVAGMMIAETKYKSAIEADLIPFRDLLLGLFFISVGLQIDLSVFLTQGVMIVFLVVSIMLLKIICIFGFLLFTSTKRNAIKVAFSICQVGEFALAIIAMLVSNKMLASEVAQVVTISCIITMIITPFILNNIDKIADLFVKDLEERVSQSIPGLKGHFVVFGYGKLGQELAKKLSAKNLPYLVIESDIKLVEAATNAPVYFGNANQDTSLEEASIKSAAAVILAVSNEQKLELIYQRIHSYSPETQIIMPVNADEQKLLQGEKLTGVLEEAAIARELLQNALHFKIEGQIG